MLSPSTWCQEGCRLLLLHYQLCRREGSSLADSPVESSRLSIHPKLHVLEPGQRGGKFVLTAAAAARIKRKPRLSNAWAKQTAAELSCLHWPSPTVSGVENQRTGSDGLSPLQTAWGAPSTDLLSQAHPQGEPRHMNQLPGPTDPGKGGWTRSR